MNFKEYWNSQDLDKYRTTEDYCAATWEACKKEVLQLLKDHKELESISHKGKKVYKIYGSVVDEIKKL